MMIDPEIAAEIKSVAMEEKRTAWSVMEDAARDYLKRRKQKRAKRKSTVAESPID